MRSTVDCLAVTGGEVSPWLVIVALICISGGAATLLASRRTSSRHTTASAFVVLALGLGAALSLAGSPPASASQSDCGRPIAATPSAIPTGVESPTPTPTPTPTPAAQGSIRGTVSTNGYTLIVTSPAGNYETAPGQGWNLPTFQSVSGPLATSVVTLTGAGADHTFGTADDTVATVTVSPDGTYSFTGLADGEYNVSASLPTPELGDPTKTWEYPNGSASFGTTPWQWQTPSGGVRAVTIVNGSAAVGEDFLAINNQVAASSQAD